MSTIQKRLKELGIELSNPSSPKFSYVSVNQIGNLLYLSGLDCRKNGELIMEGKLGEELTIEQGQEAARQVIINALSVLNNYLGDLERVNKVVKLLGFVNSSDGFVEQPYVMNGASDLLEQVFGEKGKHARSAIGSNELPFNTPIEIEMIVQVDDE
ncbi:RidA family protein [Halalkalibacter oceani]|uniref:RidA family protein n=1 Tax=Halalkalibacter oceani TaxID=1653776 RepID=UPI003393E73A